MTRAAFPLSKNGNKSYRLGNRHWRVVQFLAGGVSYRLLIHYSYMLGQYSAMLGAEANGDMRVLAMFELHATHGGWHMHTACGDPAGVPFGVKRGPWLSRRGGKFSPYDSQCPRDDKEAFALAVRVFRLDRGMNSGFI